MTLLLMNMDREAALITFNEKIFLENTEYNKDTITAIEILDREALPFGMKHVKDEMLLTETEEWIEHRVIPPHRDGAAGLTKVIGKNFLAASIRKARFASLTDSFWMKARNESIKWKDINFFKNRFSYDLGNMGLGLEVKDPTLNTPDLSTNGQMKKTWRRRDSKLWLLKQGMYPDYEEPFNEKIASLILEKFCSIPFVKYDLVNINGNTCSICKSFLDEGQELVTAAELCRTKERPGFISGYDHLKERCKAFEIPGYKEYLDSIRIIDYIIGNYDRHFGNIGFIYDNKVMKFIGPAPIYDNGTSLWNAHVPMPPEERPDQAEALFRKDIEPLLKKPEKLDLSKITDDLKDMLEYIYSGSKVDPKKVKAIAGITYGRAEAAKDGIERATLIKLKKQRETNIER